MYPMLLQYAMKLYLLGIQLNSIPIKSQVHSFLSLGFFSYVYTINVNTILVFMHKQTFSKEKKKMVL